MDTNYIIAGVIGIVIIFLIIKFAKKIFTALLIIVAIAGLSVAGYIYYFNMNSINDLHEKYCNDLSKRNDSLKCVCIIQPLEDDFNSRLSKDEIDNMTNVIFIKELSISMVNKRKVIKEKLKENNALNLLDEFKKDFLH